MNRKPKSYIQYIQQNKIHIVTYNVPSQIMRVSHL